MMLVTSFESNHDKKCVLTFSSRLGYKIKFNTWVYLNYSKALLFNPEIKNVPYKSGYNGSHPESQQVRNVHPNSTTLPIVHLHIFIKALLSHVNHI